MDLSRQRAHDLAVIWTTRLEVCDDPRLERWYLDQLNESIDRGEARIENLGFWNAIQRTDSPGIREFLLEKMSDESIPMELREGAGTVLFFRYGPEERRREFFRALDLGIMPNMTIWSQTLILLRDDGEATRSEMIRRVRQDPSFSRNPAFRNMIANLDSLAGDGILAELVTELETIAAREGLSDLDREHLRGSAQVLRNIRGQ